MNREWSWAGTTGVAVLLVFGAFALYQQALRIGLLSDDYALLMWARRLELASHDWGQLRPLPILAWWAVAQATSVSRTPAALHALNITLHGVNALLVYVLAGRFTTARFAPLAAGALFLTMPVSVEPVAWGSGVFDVMMTTFALLMGVVATSRRELRPADQALCLVLTVAMIGAKETGVIAGPLLLLLYWARWGRVTRAAIGLATVQLLLAGSYTLVRELTGWLDHRLVPRPDAWGIGRLISGAMRAFLPLHHDVIQAHPVLAVASTIVIAGLLVAWPFRWWQIPSGPRVAALAVAGTFVCIAPAIRVFGITPDLQGTRYVYLASAWWSIALASALLDGWTTWGRRVAAEGVAVLIVVGAALATGAHLKAWTAAQAARDRVLLQLISVPPTCREVAATGVPDNVSGAYVFRNGLNEALATLGRSFVWVEPGHATPECTVNVSSVPAAASRP